jgi:hypothetical protein
MMSYEEATKSLPKQFNIGSRLGNAATALGNIGKTMLQDSATLKTDIAFWATLMHTVMRVQEAYITGEVEPYDDKHKDVMSPEEKTYRRNQSAMTYFREIVGVSLGWGVLKVGQAYQKKTMQQKHNYHNGSDYSISVKKGLGQFWNALAKDEPVEALPSVFTDTPVEIYKKHNYIDPVTQVLKYDPLDLTQGHKMQKVDAQLVKWGHMLRAFTPKEQAEGMKANFIWDNGFRRRVGEFFFPHEDTKSLVKMAKTAIDNGFENNKALLKLEEKGFKFAQKFIPTVVWSIPGILFAGVWLERTTLYKGPSVQKWTVSALETLGIIDSSEDDEQALADASKLATFANTKADVVAKPLPSFPYYYADAVGASLMYHQQLYGQAKPLQPELMPRAFSVLSTPTGSDSEKTTASTALSEPLNPTGNAAETPLVGKPNHIASVSKITKPSYSPPTVFNRSGFAI